ncbi:MAG: hypothetical protein ABJC39_04965 [Chloroflexota bacterium]
MRATNPTRLAQRRGLVTGLVTIAVLSLSVFAAGTAFAANPTWVVGHGTDSSLPSTQQPASGASTSAVAAGNEVGFFEWLRNDDTSNISQLNLTASTSPSATVVGARWTIKNTTGSNVLTGTCATATPLTCSFGALNAGYTVYVTAAFTSGSNLADGSSQSVHFAFSTTGVPGGKNNSHGDAKTIDDSVAITSNGDANGDFNLNDASITVADDLVLSNSKNPQATSVTVDANTVGAAVGDSPALTTPCDTTVTTGFPSFFTCSLLTSLTSTVEVGNGKTFSNPNGAGTAGIKVIVAVAKAPGQLTGTNPFVYHYWTDTAGAHAELVTATCSLSGGFPTNTGPCLIVGTKLVTVWLSHNGRMRM